MRAHSFAGLLAVLIAVPCGLSVAGAATRSTGTSAAEDPAQRAALAYTLFLEARAAMSLGNTDGARDRLEQILELDPEAATPRALLARLCLETGDLDCAEKAARDAVARDPAEVDARRVLAQLALRAWRAERDDARLVEALGHLAAATEARPQDTGSWISRIRLLASVGRLDEAEQVAARAAATPGIDPATPYIALVRLLVASGRRDRAIDILARSEVRGPAAVPLLEMLADLYNARGDLAGQERTLTRLWDLRRGDFALARQLGRTRLELGDPFGAIAPLRAALELRSSDPDAAVDLARAFVALGRGAEAEPLIATLPLAYQRRPPVLHLWARAAEQAGRHQAAAERLGTLIALLDEDQRRDLEGALRFRQAEAFLAAGRPDDALASLEGLEDGPPVERLRLRAIASRDGEAAAAAALEARIGADPPQPGLAALAIERALAASGLEQARRLSAGWIGRVADPAGWASEVAAWLVAWGHPEPAAEIAAAATPGPGAPVDVIRRRASVFHAAGRLDEAEREYRRALAAGDGDVGIYNDLGYLLAERGEDLDEAIAMIKRALAERPEEAAFLDSLGFALFRAGRVSEALPLLREAARRAQGDGVAEIREHLGDVYLALGDLPRARAEWQAAIALGGRVRERVAAKLQAHADDAPDAAESESR
ncbi:MAG: hypothetical protein Kow0062_20630 [Acidobacteriota bacterium]